MPKFEYMVWRVSDLGEAGARVRASDGEQFASQERPPLYEALAEAGEAGWELAGMDGDRLIFKRQKTEA